ncbi:MAG: penicillin-binding protein 2 [Candidatus Eremiobacteraeota bacterium]|nr:penicillin-binding protein 2 [Candidatus Eremiobacteraeota bacterium]
MRRRAIARLAALFALLFAVLALQQIRLAVIEGPRLAQSPLNPRRANAAEGRGEIVASDGTVLAKSVGARRVYPVGALCVHAVGYLSARYGESGLEASFDRFLAPENESGDPLAQLRALLSTKNANAARIVTTLDLPTQRALVDALSGYAHAAGVVLDPSTGEVLALASVPSFDPRELDRIFPRLREDPNSPLLDRSTGGLYPPGSTFKIFTAAAALDLGVVDMSSTFDDDGALVIGNYSVHNDQNEVTGHQDLTGAFALSSNVDFAQIALRIGPQRWFDEAARWGLGRPIEFDVPTEADRLPSRQEVEQAPGVLAQLGFGEADLLVTPLRAALVVATIAAGGTTPRPVLVREIDRDGRRIVTPRSELAAPISATIAGEVRDMMIATVRRGTGTAAALPGVTVAGKTGTATNPGVAHAWFVAFAPAQAPRVALAVVVEHAGYGGAVSAPIARSVLRVALARGLSR